MEDIQIIDLGGDTALFDRANIDSQVATAKMYRRDIQMSISDSISMVTMDNEIAESCRYALKRGNKVIMGPSVHLAKIIACNWGNIRTEAKVISITNKQVISRGIAWDLEKNIASSFEVIRSIIDSNGRRYSDDMITVTGNAANSIAYRNAVFAVIPKTVVDKVYREAQQKITGDLSEDKALVKRRNAAIKFFFTEYGVSEEEIIAMCGKQNTSQIGIDEISLLLGIQQSLKDGDTTVDQVFKNNKTVEERKLKMKTKTEMP